VYFGEWWQPLVDESLKPTQRGAFGAFGVGGGKELAERKGISE
jgi:hypothetical protein